MRLLFFLATVLGLLVALISGCGTNSTTSNSGMLGSAPSATPTFDAKTVVGGIVGLSTVGRGGRPPLEFGPSVSRPLAGARVSLLDLPEVSTVTDERGSFTLRGIPGGAQTLVFEAGGARYEQPVTLAEGQAVTLGEQRLTREEAFALARGLLPEAQAGNVRMFASQNPLPAGARLTTLAAQAESGTAAPDDEVVLTEPAWLFLIDAQTEANFGHEVRHVLVADQTQQLTQLTRYWWPKLNGVSLWSTSNQADVQDVVLQPSPQPISARVSLPRTLAERRTGGRLFALYVQGGDESVFKQGVAIAQQALKADVEDFIRPVTGKAKYLQLADNKNPFFTVQLEGKFNELNEQMTPRDTFLLYVSSHGGEDGRGRGTGRFCFSANPLTDEFVNASEVVNILKPIKACRLVIVHDCCHAASMWTFTQASNGQVDPGRSYSVQIPQFLPPSLETYAIFGSAGDKLSTYQGSPLGLFDGPQRFTRDLFKGFDEPSAEIVGAALASRVADIRGDGRATSPSVFESHGQLPEAHRVAARAPCGGTVVLPSPSPGGVVPLPSPSVPVTVSSPSPTPSASPSPPVTTSPSPSPSPTPVTPPSSPTPVTPPPTSPTPVTPPQPSPSPSPSPSASPSQGVTLVPSILEFQHCVGKTACPQTIGTPVLTNRGTRGVRVTIPSRSPFVLTPSGPIDLAPGESRPLTVVFDCSAQGTLIAELIFLVEFGDGTTSTVELNIRGNVAPCP